MTNAAHRRCWPRDRALWLVVLFAPRREEGSRMWREKVASARETRSSHPEQAGQPREAVLPPAATHSPACLGRCCPKTSGSRAHYLKCDESVRKWDGTSQTGGTRMPSPTRWRSRLSTRQPWTNAATPAPSGRIPARAGRQLSSSRPSESRHRHLPVRDLRGVAPCSRQTAGLPHPPCSAGNPGSLAAAPERRA